MTELSKQGKAQAYLTSLLNKTLRVTTSDERMFLGEFKCTDNVMLHHFNRLCPTRAPGRSIQAFISQVADEQLRSLT